MKRLTNKQTQVLRLMQESGNRVRVRPGWYTHLESPYTLRALWRKGLVKVVKRGQGFTYWGLTEEGISFRVE